MRITREGVFVVIDFEGDTLISTRGVRIEADYVIVKDSGGDAEPICVDIAPKDPEPEAVG